MDLWQLTQSTARLKAEPLAASVDLFNPSLGLHELKWNLVPLAGNLLGVTIADESAPALSLATKGLDGYVRGNDLVANYPQNEWQRFTLQVYWRIVAREADLLVVDTIVSLQTSLLECFPKALLTTRLPGGEVLAISRNDSLTIGEQISSDEPAGALVRCDGQPWSYFEMTHPTDLGCWNAARNDGIQLGHELGGEFQEKGVIRRLRVRGAFLPRKNDEQAARRLLVEFAEAEPPLTV